MLHKMMIDVVPDHVACNLVPYLRKKNVNLNKIHGFLRSKNFDPNVLSSYSTLHYHRLSLVPCEVPLIDVGVLWNYHINNAPPKCRETLIFLKLLKINKLMSYNS